MRTAPRSISCARGRGRELVKMMTYVDKRAATVDRSKLADYSILKELAQSSAVPTKR